ncbi:putative conjugative transfer protein Tra [Rickettsia endosymbiont of Ixodes pacificus]|uniref:hypothetical protein n=1 Tax=Rickettsia endosymbiont of Ixodes pacificus TaxID=1133329 RepID=UPI00061E2319|nr:hypothetical protein [Rickettsia endosymbiont of Ixodes pacificus]KJW01701.1 putative conjugative transfer protein Tra [Rickettsia endosymbiont of Ixodes pacificus]
MCIYSILSRRLERLESGGVVIGRVKDRELESTRFLYFLREECEIEINKLYEEAGLPFKVSSKSYRLLG